MDKKKDCFHFPEVKNYPVILSYSGKVERDQSNEKCYYQEVTCQLSVWWPLRNQRGIFPEQGTVGSSGAPLSSQLSDNRKTFRLCICTDSLEYREPYRANQVGMGGWGICNLMRRAGLFGQTFIHSQICKLITFVIHLSIFIIVFIFIIFFIIVVVILVLVIIQIIILFIVFIIEVIIII